VVAVVVVVVAKAEVLVVAVAVEAEEAAAAALSVAVVDSVDVVVGNDICPPQTDCFISSHCAASSHKGLHIGT